MTRRTVTSGPFGEAFLDGLGALFDGSSVFCTSNLSVHSMGLDLPCSFWSCHVSPGVRCWPLATGEVLAYSAAQGVVVGCPILGILRYFVVVSCNKTTAGTTETATTSYFKKLKIAKVS